MAGWPAQAPAGWLGRDNATRLPDDEAPPAELNNKAGADTDAGAGIDAGADDEDTEQADHKRKEEGEEDAPQEEGKEGRKGKKAGKDGGRWGTATATRFDAYPACCYDDSGDRTECERYNGCQARGGWGG